MDYIIILYIIFGVLPSLTWLAYYLRKDAHPEPKRMILAIFFWGAVSTIPVLLIQLGLDQILNASLENLQFPPLEEILSLPLANLNASFLIIVLTYWFLVISLSEEIFKYLVVRIKVIGSPHLDEPLDIMLYMVVAALGFTAVENILYLFMPSGQLSFDVLVSRTLIVSFIRFIGATFLHTLCSATIGYYLALSFCWPKKKIMYIFSGMFIAVTLHGLYNFSIMTLEDPVRIIVLILILTILAFTVFSKFEKLKKLKGICKV